VGDLAPRFPVTERAVTQEAIVLPHAVLLGSPADMDDILAAIARLQRHAPALAARG